MSIATEITRLQTAKADLKTAINAKGGSLTTELIDDYALAVDALEVGGGGEIINPGEPTKNADHLVRFFNGFGEIEYQIWVADGGSVTPPIIEGWTLNNISNTSYPTSATFTTIIEAWFNSNNNSFAPNTNITNIRKSVDFYPRYRKFPIAATPFGYFMFIELNESTGLTIDIRLTNGSTTTNNTSSLSWGDGTWINIPRTTGYSTYSYTYGAYGRYLVAVYCSNTADTRINFSATANFTDPEPITPKEALIGYQDLQYTSIFRIRGFFPNLKYYYYLPNYNVTTWSYYAALKSSKFPVVNVPINTNLADGVMLDTTMGITNSIFYSGAETVLSLNKKADATTVQQTIFNFKNTPIVYLHLVQYTINQIADKYGLAEMPKLKALFIGLHNDNSTLLTLSTIAKFENIASTVKIYVPDALLNSYKAATNWIAYADQIFAASTFNGYNNL